MCVPPTESISVGIRWVEAISKCRRKLAHRRYVFSLLFFFLFIIILSSYISFNFPSLSLTLPLLSYICFVVDERNECYLICSTNLCQCIDMMIQIQMPRDSTNTTSAQAVNPHAESLSSLCCDVKCNRVCVCVEESCRVKWRGSFWQQTNSHARTHASVIKAFRLWIETRL